MNPIRDTWPPTMDDINPVHVRTLQVIARCGSFSRAGEALHLSQPAISHQIRHLERAVGVPLLERRGRRASPTEAGVVLLTGPAGPSRSWRSRARLSIGSRAGWPDASASGPER